MSARLVAYRNSRIGRKRLFIIRSNAQQTFVTSNVDKPEEGSAKKLFEEFLQTTTIPAICQLAGNKGIINKILWIILFVTGIVMAIYQSGTLIQEYTKYAVIERSIREDEWASAFPSATVCVNSPIRWRNYSTEPGRSLVRRVNERLEKIQKGKKQLSQFFEDRQNILFTELAGLTPVQRMDLGYSWKFYGIICEWGDEKCEDQLYPFNNVFYGNCVTYNPAFNSSTVKSATKSESLYITVRTNFDDEFPTLIRDKGAVLLIHPPGTAPVLNRRLIYNLFPGRWLRLGVTKKVFRRLPAPYSSKCVQSDTIALQNTSLYYSDETPYLYSIEACSESCAQEAAIKVCSCAAPTIAIPTHSNLTVCENKRCPALQMADAKRLCECKKPCVETMYDVRVDIDDRWLEQEVWRDWLKRGLNEINSQSLNMSEVAGFEIYTATTMIETVKEEPKISWADFLGSIGGNLGLWVGVSIISMVEVIEIFSRITILEAKKLIKKFKNNKVYY